MNSTFSEINEGKGYSSLPKIDDNIFNIISFSIKETFKDLFYKNNIFFKDQSLGSLYEAYKFIPNEKWIFLFNKRSRTLNQEYSLQLSKYFSEYLEGILDSQVEISDDLLQGFPSFSFRVVRPFHQNDIGPLHADQWFIDIGVQPERIPKIKSQLIKFWMPINVDHETSNLLLIPYSQKNKHKYTYQTIETNNGLKPIIKDFVPKKEIFMINNKNGFPVIFNMNLIHGGALNKGNECRLSIEFEFFASKDNL